MLWGTPSSVTVKSFSVKPSMFLPSLSFTTTVSTTNCVFIWMVKGCCVGDCCPCVAGTTTQKKTNRQTFFSHGLNGFNGLGANNLHLNAPNPLNPFNPWLRTFIKTSLATLSGECA